MNTNFNALSISYATFVALLLLLSACYSARVSKEQIGKGFARAGLGNSTHIFARHDHRKNFGLDGCRSTYADVLKGVQEWFIEI